MDIDREIDNAETRLEYQLRSIRHCSSYQIQKKISKLVDLKIKKALEIQMKEIEEFLRNNAKGVSPMAAPARKTFTEGPESVFYQADPSTKKGRVYSEDLPFEGDGG